LDETAGGDEGGDRRGPRRRSAARAALRPSRPRSSQGPAGSGARRFPAIGFLGEEGTTAAGSEGRWIVDPLDGTIAFMAGLPTFGVSIALESRGVIEAGVLFFPCLGELFVTERGRGAWLNGGRLRVSARTDLTGCVVSLWHDASAWGDREQREQLGRVGRRVPAAGALLVREAGGHVTDGAGGPFVLEKPTILATNGRIHARLVALLTRRVPRIRGGG
jgi:myo-inositol-1(or 4)-monophosphatase